jgi:hypothetical protein
MDSDHIPQRHIRLSKDILDIIHKSVRNRLLPMSGVPFESSSLEDQLYDEIISKTILCRSFEFKIIRLCGSVDKKDFLSSLHNYEAIQNWFNDSRNMTPPALQIILDVVDQHLSNLAAVLIEAEQTLAGGINSQ